MTTLPGFRDALRIVLENEGGFANDPDDPGGRTMRGVTQAVYDQFRESRLQPKADVRGISQDELEAIYEGYWVGASCQRFAGTHPHLALCHFDSAVNCGTDEAALLLQRAVGAADDGIIGPKTLAAVEAVPDDRATAALLEQRAAFYRLLVQRTLINAKFLGSWLARLRRIARATGVPIMSALLRDSAELAAARES